jgi:hypothetical protein
VAADRQDIAVLRILSACGEKTVEAFQASDKIRDAALLADLERVIARSRQELVALTEEP